MDDREIQKLALERYCAGELEKEDAERLEAHCKTCGNCAGYLKTLRQSRDGFLNEHPYAQFQRRGFSLRGDLPWYRFIVSRLRRPVLMPIYGVLAALLVVTTIIPQRVMFSRSGEEILFKGNAHLSFLVKRGGKTAVGDPLDTFFGGDEIQVLYSIQRKCHISLVSVDSHGAISMYQPDTNDISCSVPAQAGANRSYPQSIILDNSKGFEMIFALFSDKPLTTTAVKKWISTAIKDSSPGFTPLPRLLESTQGKLGVKVLRKGS
jgi:hypothetical protein